MAKSTTPSPAAAFAFLVPLLTRVARENGYALTLHGSMTRDLDLVAIPWVTDASAPEELVEALKEACGGFVINDESADPYDYTRRNPEPKPHGRLAWSIHLPRMTYIDLSVMPRVIP